MTAESQFDRWLNLRRVYRAILQNGSREPRAVKTMLDDLREFCRADQSCVVVAKDGRIDTHATLLAEGRREVFLRIEQILNLSDQALNKMKELEND